MRARGCDENGVNIIRFKHFLRRRRRRGANGRGDFVSPRRRKVTDVADVETRTAEALEVNGLRNCSRTDNCDADLLWLAVHATAPLLTTLCTSAILALIYQLVQTVDQWTISHARTSESRASRRDKRPRPTPELRYVSPVECPLSRIPRDSASPTGPARTALASARSSWLESC